MIFINTKIQYIKYKNIRFKRRLVSYFFMTHCNRCGNEFDNFFNGAYWCVYCGKQFAFDENLLNQKEDKEKKGKEYK